MIRLLDKKTADKIAAGEVIDRPVSIVKELVENSLDAGATSVTIEIREGGRSYIRVTDNGCGIPADQVETAFLRHATSKISDVKDLDSIETLGFRGEALASICAVSRVELITKTEDAKAGRRITMEGSRVLDNSTFGCPEGTTITVKDLFFNLPARYKFLNSDASEARRIIDFLSRIALAYPDVRFNVINGSKNVFTTAGRGDILSNIISIYGADIGRDLIPVERAAAGFTLKGFVSGPGSSMPSRNRQIFCVNGRIISSSAMERALDKAYRERLFSGRFPVAFLFLAMPPEKLDVNIHPTKKEIRFDDNSEVEDFVTSAVAEALLSKEAIPEVRKPGPSMAKQDQGEQISFSSQQKKADIQDESFIYKADAHKPADSIKEEEKTAAAIEKKAAAADKVDIKHVLSTLRTKKEKETKEPVKTVEREAIIPKPFDFDSLRLIGSVFNTYIAAEADGVFYLIDQHAAHERIFYEKLLKQYNSSEKLMQQMLIPFNISVSADVTATEDMWIKQLRNMGYDIEYFGNNTYIVREVPAFMEQIEAENFLKDILNEFSEKPDLTNKAVLDRIITRSCKSAVKAGDALTAEETEALFAQLKSCDNPFSCPHGRPSFIKMTKYEIERMFKRV